MELLLTHRIFGTEELSAYSRPAMKGEADPQTDDASRGCASG
jgi:hypothetical protein